MTTLDWTAVERAAEQTIGAAAAAVLWAGEDEQGVLAHVAGTTATKIAESRIGYAMACAARPAGFDDEMLLGMCSVFEQAALPGSVAPTWQNSVSAAMSDALRDRRDHDMNADADGRVVARSESRDRWRAIHASVRYHALWVCSLWAQDPLPLNLIERGSHIVSYTTAPPGRV